MRFTRRFSILVPSGTRFFNVSCMFLYFVFRFIITPILALPRDVYVLSQDINKFLSTKKNLPMPRLFPAFPGNCPMLLVVGYHLHKVVTVE